MNREFPLNLHMSKQYEESEKPLINWDEKFSNEEMSRFSNEIYI